MDKSFWSDRIMWPLRDNLYFNNIEVKFKEKLIEMINIINDTDENSFFYDMLPCIRFIYDKTDDIAYTTKDKLIFLNAPGKPGKDVGVWDFIYTHECLHQLWNTFKVGDNIEKEQGSCNRYLLNIASDCVINDFLRDVYKKKPYESGIFPEYIKEQYGVDYDRKKDTQYSLYMKILPYAKQMQQDQNLQQQAGDTQEQQGEGKNGQGQGVGQNNQNGNQQNQGGNQGGDQQGQNGNQQNQGGNQGGDQQGQGGNQNGQSSNQQGQNSNKPGKGGSYDYPDISEIRAYADNIIKEYTNRLKGPIGEFVKKTQTAEKCKSGIAVQTQGASKNWAKELDLAVNSYIKQRVNKLKREWENTYSRVKRGSGFIKWGDPIQPGRKVKEQKAVLKLGFYIDVSGSMSNCIKEVFRAAKTIASSLSSKYRNEKVIEDFEFNIYQFDDYITKINDFKVQGRAGGGTCPFDNITNHIVTNNKDCVINIIITDAGFDVNTSKLDANLKQLEGSIIFVTNVPSQAVQRYAKSHKDKITYIEADSDFTVKI